MSKIAFMFSGQGAQYPGMLKDLYDRIPAAREIFEKADAVLGRPISDICFYGTQEELNHTHNTQPCMLAADLAVYSALFSYGIKPDIMSGFSLGEYAALIASGAISFEDGFRIVQARADAMQEAAPLGAGGMAAIAGDVSEDIVFSICEEVYEYVEPSNFNHPGQTAVSGTATGIDEFIALAKKKGFRAGKLPVSAPFHSTLMQPAALKLQEVLKMVTFSSLTYPVISNVDADFYANQNIAEKLFLQAKQPVLWKQTLVKMKQIGVDIFIQLGPGKTLCGCVKKTLSDVTIMNVADIASLKETLNFFKISDI